MRAARTCAVVLGLCAAVVVAASRAQPPAEAIAPAPAATLQPGTGLTPKPPDSVGYLARREPQCTDFHAEAGGGWRALASVSFPGPRGPVRVTAGESVSPGVFVDGLDVGAILQKRCT